MKKTLASLAALALTVPAMSQGWPANYGGVMLQGFYWDSYNDSQWSVLESQADELAQYFQLVWIPQSGNCRGTSMGYDDYWWFPGNSNNTSYNSSFGTEQQLRSMIATFKQKGIGTIADVVINHRKNRSTWFDFPTETYNGKTYKMVATDICKNDDGGAAKTEADRQGVEISANLDTGEDWAGMRDLDHKSENVQTIVKAYLHMLLSDLGYAGFRYDMVKGYGASYTGLYNSDAQPKFSVGEYWDGNTSMVKAWLNRTKVNDVIQSAAFDFPFRYTVRDAVNNTASWASLGNTSVAADANYRRYSVTFIENHDTEFRSPDAQQDPIRRDTLAGNAFLMAMPGTPCVFFKHWLELKPFIKPMIEARRLAGITNTSSFSKLLSGKTCYAFSTDDRLLAVLSNTAEYTPDGSWVKIIDGYHYAYYLHNSVGNQTWVSHASGRYKGEQHVLLAALGNQGAEVAYTLDGSTPTAGSPRVASGTTITIPAGTTTLKAAMLVGGSVSGSVVTRTFEVQEDIPFSIPDFCVMADGELGAFFEAPATWTGTINCWAWKDGGSNVNYTGGTWPGVACTKLGTSAEGLAVWKWTFKESDYKGTAGTATSPSHIIFNNGSSQTDNLVFTNGGYYNQLGLRGTVTGISTVTADRTNAPTRVYTLDGRYMGTDITRLPRGVYVTGGKKVVK